MSADGENRHANPLASVLKRLAGVAVKRPGLALGLWGDPGVGKTHTVQRLLRETPVRGLSLHATAPLPDLIRSLPRPSRLPVWAERVLERLERAEHVEASGITEALAAVLSGLAPVLLHLEDAHEASAERMALIEALAQAVGRSRGVALLVTSRTVLPEPFESHRITPLEPEGTKQLLETEAGAKLPREALDWIHARAHGNPLFTLEHFRYLARQGYLWNDSRRWFWRSPPANFVPVSVEAMIERALRDATATPTLQAVLGAKAMLPAGTNDTLKNDTLWAQVSGVTLEAFEAARRDLERSGVIVNHEFVHPLYREVMTHELLPDQRRSFAQRAFAALHEVPEAAAAFIEDAGLDAESALEALERAADHARQSGNPVRAARFLARAVDHQRGEARGHTAMQAALVLHPVDLAEAARLFALALEARPHDPEVIVALAESQAQLKNLSAAIETLGRLDDSSDDPAHLAHVFSLRVLGGDLAGALELWREHPQLETLNAKTASRLAGALSLTGNAAEAVRVAERALKQPGLPVGDAINLRNYLANALFYQGKLTQAETVWDELIVMAAAHGFARLRAGALVNRSQARVRTGRLESVSDDIREAARIVLEANDLRTYAHIQVMLGDVLTRQAEFERAEEALLEARSLLEGGLSVTLVNAELALSALYTDWGAAHAAFLGPRHARQALKVARALGNAMLSLSALAVLAYSEAQSGEAASALEHADQAVQEAGALGQPFLRFAALNARGAALRASGRNPEALETYREVLALAEAAGMEEPAWQVRVDIAHLEADAVTALECLRWFEAHGLANSVGAVRRRFPNLEVSGEAEQPSVRHTPMAQTAAPAEETTALRLCLLGPMQVTRNGQALAVRGRKRQELLARLLEARVCGRAEVNRLELIDAMYPDADEVQAATSLKDVVHQLRSSLGQGVIQTTPNGYALGAVGSDVEAFLSGGDPSLWRGAYLDGLDLEPHDGSVREALDLALRSRIRTLLETDPKEAARLSRLLIEAEPFDREALNLCLSALRSSGNHRSLTRLYDEARSRFEEVGESLPGDWKQFLAAA